MAFKTPHLGCACRGADAFGGRGLAEGRERRLELVLLELLPVAVVVSHQKERRIAFGKVGRQPLDHGTVHARSLEDTTHALLQRAVADLRPERRPERRSERTMRGNPKALRRRFDGTPMALTFSQRVSLGARVS